MKKTKHLSRFTFVLAITLFIGCNENNKTKPQQEDHSSEKPRLVEAPENIISLEQADAIYNNYTKHRAALIENYEAKERSVNENFEAARFVDFDYQTIKDYIAFVDQEATKAGVKKVSKLRMYFANYPDDKTFPDGKEVVHQRQNSIFIVPTVPVDGGNYGFYIGDDGKAKLIIDWQEEIQKGMGYLLNNSQRNHASLVPTVFKNNTLFRSQSLTLNYGHGGPPPKTDF